MATVSLECPDKPGIDARNRLSDCGPNWTGQAFAAQNKSFHPIKMTKTIDWTDVG